MMPNRYLPSALVDMIDERQTALNKDKSDDGEYVAEHEVLVDMLQPEHQEEYRQRRGEA